MEKKLELSNQENTGLKHIFIIGSKGIPANYGGFETFVENLTFERRDKAIQYHVACMDNSGKHDEFEHNGAHCFRVPVHKIGSAKAIEYDILAFRQCLRYIEKNEIQGAVIYVLACRIGPFIAPLKRRLERLGGKLYLNPDGHEWKRAKWNAAIRRYWKLSERLMVKSTDLLICDSKSIEKYIQQDYAQYAPKTTFIAYGADVVPSELQDDDPIWNMWLQSHGLQPKQYYLVVGRSVPENNYETMLREFMCSKSKRDFVLVTNASDAFLEQLEAQTGFQRDERIKFVGTVYDQQLLRKIRENAYGYLHGHEVGGTNPSLLEALGSTALNLLLDVGFNREVAEEAALYWSKGAGDLAAVIDRAERLSEDERAALGEKAKKRIESEYSWAHIVGLYEEEFKK